MNFIFLYTVMTHDTLKEKKEEKEMRTQTRISQILFKSKSPISKRRFGAIIRRWADGVCSENIVLDRLDVVVRS
jgi:hypothetical protein